MKPINILVVCSAGTISCANTTIKLKERLIEEGVTTNIIECSSIESEEIIGKNEFDLIACISPIYNDYKIPKVNIIGLMTGHSEDTVINECVEIIENIRVMRKA